MKSCVAPLAGLALVLATAPVGAQNAPLPPGPYRAACRNLALDASGQVLSGLCPNSQGGFVQTSLRLPCRFEIAVGPQGRLFCRNGSAQASAPVPPPPPTKPASNPYPPGRGTPPPGRIRLFGVSRYDGKAVVVAVAMPDLRAGGFDDTASSLKVERGRWQVCTEPNYLGRCELVDGEIPNLIAMRMDDQISSLRPWWPRDR